MKALYMYQAVSAVRNKRRENKGAEQGGQKEEAGLERKGRRNRSVNRQRKNPSNSVLQGTVSSHKSNMVNRRKE